jgi:predicted dithiol-disulfide oxidoreductase (DUF899 family)
MAVSATFVRQQLISPMEPPRSAVGTPAWLRQKLFGSVFNAVATLVSAAILIVYHFMWRWDLGAGCKSCSLLVDHVDGANVHLANHDVSFVAISRGKLADLEAYWKRMGWKFDFASSYGSDFNFDYHVSFTDEQMASGKLYYNYQWMDEKYGLNELPGASVFYKDESGNIFHTYSTYARGGDILLGVYNYLDLTPKGRNEQQIMEWVKRHDEYEPRGSNTPSCCHA